MKKLHLSLLFVCAVLYSNAQWSSNTSENIKAAILPSSDIVTVGTNDGRTYVAYYTPLNGSYYIRVQLLDDDGTRLLGDSGILVSPRNSGSATYVFTACVDTSDNLIIGYQYERGSVLRPLVSKISPKGKLLWGATGIELGFGLSPSVAALSNGDVAIAWNNDTLINYQKITADGSIAWATPKELTNPSGVTRPQVVALTDSSFGIVYQQKSGFFSSNLYEQRFDNEGNPVWAGPVQLSDYITSTFKSYSVLSDADVTYIGYYANPSGENRFDGFVQKVNGDGSLPWGLNGSSFGSYTGGSDPNFFDVNIAYNTGSDRIWAVSTMSDFNQVNYGIAVQKYDVVTGEKLLGDNGKTVFEISASSERQVGDLSICDNGPLFTFYDITNKLYATGLDTSGEFVWNPVKTEIGSTTNEKGRYGFTRVNHNQAVAVWQENKDTADFAYAQNINCDGTTGSVLPVSLTNFAGSIHNRIVSLSWQTKTENNNKGFHVQRSSDGSNFSSISFVATKAQGGNSSGLLEYTTTDQKPFSGNNYYRLMQEDNDGKLTYSNVILVKNAGTFGMRMNNIYPNPSYGVVNIYIESVLNDKVSFIVSDASGKIVKQFHSDIVSGNNNIQMNIASLAAGNYFIKLISKNFYENAVQHFIKH
ncbi:MAG: T9SS type A sorting domain-containing protein [Panacibacter sp.]